MDAERPLRVRKFAAQPESIPDSDRLQSAGSSKFLFEAVEGLTGVFEKCPVPISFKSPCEILQY